MLIKRSARQRLVSISHNNTYDYTYLQTYIYRVSYETDSAVRAI